MTLSLEQSISRIPFLAHAADLVTIPLSGGITNLNYKIEAGGKAYVLRISGADTNKLGIRRDLEHAANLAAGQLGIAPEVLYYIEPEGYLLTRFIKGRHIPPEVLSRPENIERVVRKLRLFHRRGPVLDGEFNGFRQIEMLRAASKQHGAKFPVDFDWIMQKVAEVEQALLTAPHTPTPCHNDLLNLNWMEEEVAGDITELRLLDWEYAGMGDVFFDLANFSHNHALNDERVRQLLQTYFGEVTEPRFARLQLMWPISELREALWGTTQTGISKLDEDFQGYADLWFGRARLRLVDPRWEQWLAQASGDKPRAGRRQKALVN